MIDAEQTAAYGLVEKIRKYLDCTVVAGAAFPQVCTYQSVPLIGKGHQSVVLNLGHGKILSLCLIENTNERAL